MEVRCSDAWSELKTLDVGMHELARFAGFDDDIVEAGSFSTSLETSSKSCQCLQDLLQLWKTNEEGRREAFRLGPDTQGGQLSLRSLRLMELTAWSEVA